MYTERDLDKSENILKAVIIQFIIDNKITFEQFSEMHKEYLLSIGCPLNEIASAKNNLLKSMRLKGMNGFTAMTYPRFSYICKNIFKLNLQNFSLTFKTKDNDLKVISMDWITF